MEVSKLPEGGVKIKSRLALIGINPIAGKGPIDAAILLDRTIPKEKIITEGGPVIINGQGEYEIKGVKLNGIGKEDAVAYSGRIDNMRVCIIKASTLSKAKDSLEESEVVIVDTDVVPDQKVIAGLNPNVVILYGGNVTESAKIFGKETVPVAKYSITRDKLPGEMEIVLLS